MKINILGSEYELIYGTPDEYEVLSEIDGFTDPSTRKIIIDSMQGVERDKFAKGNINGYKMEVCRHEIIHAFLYESGLATNSNECKSWATNEEMVDWFAIQIPKIQKAFKEAGCEN